MERMTRTYYETLNNFHSRIESELTILLYHGVTRSKSRGIENRSGKHMRADIFADQMRYIKNNCTVLSMDEYLDINLNGQDLPPRSVVVSFDDGFRNNYSVAAPILHDLHMPAIFYISSGMVNTDLMFWVDVLEDCINLTSRHTISLKLNKNRSFPTRTEAQKLEALHSIKSYCKSVSQLEYKRVLNDLQSATKITASVAHAENYEVIKWDELREMDRDPLFTIGGHAMYHDILSQLPEDRLDLEIRTSLDLLHLHLGHGVEHYSYPEGQDNHYNEHIIRKLKGRGIICCPSAIPGLNPKGTDVFHLRRIMIGFAGIPFPYEDDQL